jgi:diacylglycerol O-acyltransferase
MRSGSERLAPADEANIVLDHAGQINVFLVAALLGSGGFIATDGTPDLAALRRELSPRVAALPTLRKALVADGRRHAWIEASPDLQHHVRLIEATEEATGLERLCAGLMTVPLDRGRPLWEVLVVPRARAQQTAVVLRIHHAIADGLAAVAIAQGLFDSEPRRDPPTPDRPRHPSSVAAKRSPLARFRFGLHRIGTTLGGREVGSTVLLGERSDRRDVIFVDVDRRALESRIRPREATVNDALLAAVAAGYRAALEAAGENIPERLPVSVPVALERHGSARNQVGVMLVRLPLGTADPDERLRLIAAQTRVEKLEARDQGTLEFMRGPVGARIMDRFARRQHLVGGFVTNVRGPAGLQHLAGAPIERIWPVAVLAANVRLGVAALSVSGRLCIGIHFDAQNVPGDAFARAVHHELARLTV